MWKTHHPQMNRGNKTLPKSPEILLGSNEILISLSCLEYSWNINGELFISCINFITNGSTDEMIAQMRDANLLWQHPSPLEPPVAVSKLNSGRKRSCSTQGLVADFKDPVFFLWVVLFGRPFPRSLSHIFFAGVTICTLQTCFKWVCFLVLSYPFAKYRALTTNLPHRQAPAPLLGR